MITKRSRYVKTALVPIPQPGTTEPAQLIGLREIPNIPAVFVQTPTAADRLDTLASTNYRDPTQFFRICDGSDQLDPFDVIEPGVPLPIPPQR
jgi:hypothetical protein